MGFTYIKPFHYYTGTGDTAYITVRVKWPERSKAGTKFFYFLYYHSVFLRYILRFFLLEQIAQITELPVEEIIKLINDVQ